MPLSIGIVGLPNVGKSTVFNALTQAQKAQVANYPFCTIEPNKAVVEVPDPRLDKLAELVKQEKVIHASIEFVDIAGLVRGASLGEGLGNQFLGQIRETSVIVHVVRCFEDENVAHVHEKPDAIDDVEVINTELCLADLEQLERRIERLTKQLKGDNSLKPAFDTANALQDHLAKGLPVAAFAPQAVEPFNELVREMGFITAKKVIYAANVGEEDIARDNPKVEALRKRAAKEGAEVVCLCAKIEEEMAGLTGEERTEFLESLGADESGLEQVIHASYRELGLISFFTAGPKQVRAWTLNDGDTAQEAAGIIHTDFARGFIRAEVIPYESFIADGSEAAAKAAGHMRAEGKVYVVQDADVIYFLFNV